MKSSEAGNQENLE
jgi:basic amino acid/polyamine antiporter, APA family